MDVPEDIREKARGIVAEIDADWSYDGQVFDFSKEQADVENAIAQALLSERLAQKERDAKIAEETGKAYCRDHFVMMGPAGIAHSIMLAIRQS